ncbi:sialic acid-binding Ig-like lectin 10 isoform X1 [Choloepus didactylus]|uniref:sialic acid-binding Ig-like lectin 10 isoform X1 n=1 Tax=Choloepus didactylus TaxID=27675 RepID=UPI00189CE868|nr:sialic acid-binding Ig-like lectin 10 isoform X1 [Choloepus didactylus]
MSPLLLLLLLSLLTGESSFWKPEFMLQVPELVTVQEGLCVLVPCTVSYPLRGWHSSDLAHGYWYREEDWPDKRLLVATNNPDWPVQEETRGRFQLLGDPQNMRCSLLIRDAQAGDTATYFFRVERGSYVRYNFLENKLTLEVTALTQKPDVYVPEILEPGLPATLVCVFNLTSEGCPAPALSWLGAAVSAQDARPRTSHFSVLTFTPRPQDHNTDLTCQVDFSRQGVSTSRTVRLHVAHAPKDVVISVSRADAPALESWRNIQYLEATKGQSLRLLCAADSQPPAVLSWMREDRVLSWSVPSDSGSLGLELPGVEVGDAGRYTCRAQNTLGSGSRTLQLSVQYAPENLRVMVSQSNRTVLEKVENGTFLPVQEGQSLRLVCVADSNPPARLSWARGSQALSPSQPSDPGVLELPPVQMEHEGELTCRAENPLGSDQVSLLLSVIYPPQLLSPSCSWEAEGLRCSCSARAQPAPSLRWRLGEELVEGTRGNASFTVTSSAARPWAHSNLSLHGGLDPSLRLSCEAQNAHGHQRVTVLLLPGKKGLISTAFSKGAFLGTGITTFLSLCLVLIVVKILRGKRSGALKPRPRASRGSSIMDYVNVIPNTFSRARNQRVDPAGPSQTPPPDPHTLKSKNPKELRFATLSGPGSKSLTQAPESETSSEELHYAVLNFPGLRQWETQAEYAEVKFHRGSAELQDKSPRLGRKPEK